MTSAAWVADFGGLPRVRPGGRPRLLSKDPLSPDPDGAGGDGFGGDTLVDLDGLFYTENMNTSVRSSRQ